MKLEILYRDGTYRAENIVEFEDSIFIEEDGKKYYNIDYVDYNKKKVSLTPSLYQKYQWIKIDGRTFYAFVGYVEKDLKVTDEVIENYGYKK